MTQQATIGKTATKVTTSEDCGAVKYHNTVVVAWTANTIELNTGGWYTSTTKTRMNQASIEFNLGYNVYQRDYNWFCDYNGEIYEFLTSKLTIDRQA